MNYNQIIEDSGLKKRYIAEKVGVSRQFLYQCFSGKKKLPEKRKEVLHRLLGLN